MGWSREQCQEARHSLWGEPAMSSSLPTRPEVPLVSIPQTKEGSREVGHLHVVSLPVDGGDRSQSGVPVS